MSGKSNISWTDYSWNPTSGCSRVSPGCQNCYAFALHDQRHNAYLAGKFPDAPAQYHKPFSEVQLIPARLEDPLRWRKPRRVFVNSVSDLFHKDIPDEFRDRVWAVMLLAPIHTFQILTKRPQAMHRYVTDPDLYDRVLAIAHEYRSVRPALGDIPISDPMKHLAENIWLGVSVESQEWAWRIDWLVRTPAAVRFLSCEPLLGPLDIESWFPVRDYRPTNAYWRTFTGDPDPTPITVKPGVDWVIAGGESGKGFRPIDPDWLRGLRDQCAAAGVPFFLKQGSGLRPGMHRELDGRTWEQFPEQTR